MQTTPPRGVVHRAGTPVSRRMGFVRPEALTCRFGHSIRENGLIREDGAIECTWRAHRGAAICGTLVYVLVVPTVGQLRRRLWAADVEFAELRHWELERFDLDRVMDWLGAAFPAHRPARG